MRTLRFTFIHPNVRAYYLRNLQVCSCLVFWRAHEHVQALYIEDGAYSWVFCLCASTLMSGLALRENSVVRRNQE